MEKYYLGIELGSTRVKAVVIDGFGTTVSIADYSWKSELVDGYWSYDLNEVDKSVDYVLENLNIDLSKISAMGVSAMMHGFLAFDKDDNLLTPFRTWQNTSTSEASQKLSELFKFNIPERWSIAHLYQAILDNESFIKDIDYITTLAGYVHYRLTKQKVLGIGDASGMFPVDSQLKTYNKKFVSAFDSLLENYGLPYKLLDILPEIKLAGQEAGKYLNINVCPPEGDAGTGMIATNAIKPNTGNVSAGTSVFAMVVLDNPLKSYYSQIDIVTTVLGDEVAMVHANNCTLDINAWVEVFAQMLTNYGVDVDYDKLYSTLFNLALSGDKNGGGLINYPYVTGEQIVGIETGIPTFMRLPNSNFTLANFFRTQLMSCLSALKIGFDILNKNEQVNVQKMLGHGGLFKTAKVGQEIMSAALKCEVGVMETANEGGAWGMAILASYADKVKNNQNESLFDYLDYHIFKDISVVSVSASTADFDGFNEYMQNFNDNLQLAQNKRG